MLILHQLLCVLFTLRGIFMHFLELTYWWDAIVPVPIFYCFCVSEKLHRKYSQNWTKWSPKFLFSPDTRRSPKKSRRGARRWPHHLVAWVPLVVRCWCRSFIYITAQLETPREGYDEHSSKTSLSCETKVYRTSRRKNQTSEGWCPLALRRLRTMAPKNLSRA
jgi:hypothetical protein